MEIKITIDNVEQVLDAIDPRLIEQYMRKKKLENCMNPQTFEPLELSIKDNVNYDNLFSSYDSFSKTNYNIIK